MPNGDIDLGFWAKAAGMVSMAVGGPLAVMRSTVVGKKEFKTAQAECRTELHEKIERIEEKQDRQTAWIMAIAQATGVKKEDVREL